MDLNQDMKPSHTQVQENGIIFLSMHSIDYNVVDNEPRRRWGRWAPPLTHPTAMKGDFVINNERIFKVIDGVVLPGFI